MIISGVTLRGGNYYGPIIPATDPYFNQVSILLPGTGANNANNNTFLDSSTNNFAITRNGNPTQGTYSPYSPAGWSNYFDGTGDYLTAPSNAAFDFGTGDFTIESWVYLTKYSSGYNGYYIAAIVSRDQNAGNANRNYWVNLGGTASSWSSVSFGFFNSTTLYSKNENYSFNLNTWYHIAVVRNSGTVNIYVNGAAVGSGTVMSQAPNTLAIPLYIGQQGYPTYEYYLPGYISNLRIVKGTAVYTTNFTLPVAALTAISGTSLLTCQSNRFIDNSTNAFAITANGDVRVTNWTPFAPTAAWSAGTSGGSAIFDGVDDYLSISRILDSNVDVTIEAWVYITATPGSNGAYLLSQYILNDSNRTIFSAGGGGSAAMQFGSVSAASTTTVRLYEWTHLAWVRSGNSTNNWKQYINGIQDGTLTYTGTYANTPTTIGGSPNLANTYFPGYISNLRIVKGTAVYTGNFTPPAQPVIAIANTALLLNSTNAGIYDAATRNDVETVGDAKISTAQSKYAGSSMVFDGTGDYLSTPANPMFALGPGNFTVEAWVYINADSSADAGGSRFAVIASTKQNGSTGFTCEILGNTTVTGTGLTFEADDGTNQGYSATVSVPKQTWNHIAWVRSGTTLTFYLNGASAGTATVSQNIPNSQALTIGGQTNSQNYQRYLNGYINDLRITKGVARYTANFTPPAAAFPVQ